jgi:branched-chain amino acid transport system permease protein
MLRSGSVLIATVIGGSGAFFGPVAGAVVLTFFSVVVASVTRAWLLYLGLFFVAVVVGSPDGIAGWTRRQAARLARDGWRGCLPWFAWRAAAACAWSLAIVLGAQWAYAQRFGADDPARPLAAMAGAWLVPAVLCLAGIGWLTTRAAARIDGRLAAEARMDTRA